MRSPIENMSSWLRAGATAALVAVGGCGGGGGSDGGGDQAAPDSTPPPAHAQLVAGPARPVDTGASGTPVGLRVAASASGDGFAVWRALNGGQHDLWANRYRAATAAWGEPVPLEAGGADILDFDLTVDARGNAVVAWQEKASSPSSGIVQSTRFDAAVGAWSAPVPLSSDGVQPRVASDARGNVLAVYVGVGAHLVRGRFYNPVDGTWEAESAIEQNTTGTGFSTAPAAVLDGNGNALVAFSALRTAAGGLSSNYFAREGGGWAQLPPDEVGSLGEIPGSFNTEGPIGDVQLAAVDDGNFLAVWETGENWDVPELSKILVSRFTASTRRWTPAQTLVPADAGKNVRFQRIGSDAQGNVFLLWTQTEGTRTALLATRLSHDGAVCSPVEVIDRAVGGGAARADLAVDPQGHAMAIWQQFEGGRADDGSRSNIAINRFDAATGRWDSAVLAETQEGNASVPRASAFSGQALLGWIQVDGAASHVQVLVQALADVP